MARLSLSYLKDEYPGVLEASLPFVDQYIARKAKDGAAPDARAKLEMARMHGYPDIATWLRSLEYYHGATMMFGIIAFELLNGRLPKDVKEEAEISDFLDEVRRVRWVKLSGGPGGA